MFLALNCVELDQHLITMMHVMKNNVATWSIKQHAYIGCQYGVLLWHEDKQNTGGTGF